MNRYLLFAGNDYYPDGGWHDFKGSFHTLDGAEAAYRDWQARPYDEGGTGEWGHVVDTKTGEVVFKDEREPAVMVD